VNGLGSYFNDVSVGSNGGQCSGDSCTSVAEGYCTSDGKVSNILMSCSTGYSVNGACAAKATPVANLTVSLSPSSSTAPQFIPVGNNGAANATKATYNFTSTGGQSVISELKFTVNGANTVTSISVAGISAPVVNGVVWLTGLNLYVSSYGSNQDFYVSYSGVGPNGVPSGSTSSVALTYVKYSSNGTTSVYTPNISAPTMKLVGSSPSVSINSSNAILATGLV